MSSICDIEINPGAVSDIVCQSCRDSDKFRQENAVIPTANVSTDSRFFSAIISIAQIIADGTKYNKKARIVLEYDPQMPKMQITTYMSRDEAPQPEAQ